MISDSRAWPQNQGRRGSVESWDKVTPSKRASPCEARASALPRESRNQDFYHIFLNVGYNSFKIICWPNTACPWGWIWSLGPRFAPFAYSLSYKRTDVQFTHITQLLRKKHCLAEQFCLSKSFRCCLFTVSTVPTHSLPWSLYTKLPYRKR